MKKFIIPALAFAPFLASAQTVGNLSGFSSLLKSIGGLISTALPIVIGLALLGFFWGLAMFVFNAADEGKRAEARQIMIWGVVALFAMTAVWGLVNFFSQAVLGSTPGSAGAPQTPTVQGLPQG
jgi:hypothetical protein